MSGTPKYSKPGAPVYSVRGALKPSEKGARNMARMLAHAYMRSTWGERCAEVAPGCACCAAWARWDALDVPGATAQDYQDALRAWRSIDARRVTP